MASLAVHMRVLALAFHIQNICMAGLASLVTGKLHGSSRNLADGRTAIVSILSEALWNHEVSNHKKDNKSENEESRESEEMPGILENAHCSPIS
jgi:hypothetical protein